MNPALASLIALLLAIVLSMISRINVGLVAIALAWLVGVYLAGMKADAVIAGFPANLFLTLTGVTLLFACAETNGTLKWLAHRAVQLVRGNRTLLPILFFFVAMVISTVGPGAIASVALVVPLAMVIGNRAGVSRLLTALMVANGANAGNLSPISSLGVIANTKMAEAGVGSHEGKVWFANFIAHLLVAIAAYGLFGGWKKQPSHSPDSEAPAVEDEISMSRQQRFTLIIILLWIVGVLFFKLHLGLSTFAAVIILVGARVADETASVKKVPWGVILMVCGVSLLIAILEKTGGMELFTAMIARVASQTTINGVISFITGIISTYSSTSGVVLPAFIPTAPKLAQQIGGDPLAIALSINVGSSIVDVSPLSTLGALCIATISDATESKMLFWQLLIWGLSMTIVGALFCQFFAGMIARF
ncbi:MAG: C4-dicarboxylate ABC transporter [Acidobacteria bacterium]|nr:C4-dicarboxylate ABC transporter [Acidobacteriota bacterium]